MIILKIVFALSFVFMITMNILANALPLFGVSTGAMSKRYDNLFTPSGMTFSIWGLIYVLLTGVVIYVLFKDQQTLELPVWRNLMILLSMSSVLNGVWLFFWHGDRQVIATLIMISLLITLIFLFSITPHSEVLMKITSSVYLGWISVATIAQITILLTKFNFSGFNLSSEYWLIFVLVLGFILSLIFLFTTKNTVFVFVIIWAYLGIISRHLSQSDWNRAYPYAIYT
ncbi:MAG: hypothetical protein EOM23_11450, partial [Candidatus Moranbacteria bacterium]|nr:hypothetical protein [Candidatus Moranbacteria bacterium]